MSNVCIFGETTYSAHGRTSVSFDGNPSNVYAGAVGVYPGNSVTGFQGIPVSSDRAAKFADHAQADHTALSNVDTPSDDKMGGAVEMGGATFTPGVHRAETSITVTVNTQVTLEGAGDYLFQAGTTLTTGADTSVVLKNADGTAGDPDAFNIVWVLGTGATLGARSILPGSINAGTAVTIGSEAGVTGCAIAQTAVTFENNGCASCP